MQLQPEKLELGIRKMRSSDLAVEQPALNSPRSRSSAVFSSASGLPIANLPSTIFVNRAQAAGKSPDSETQVKDFQVSECVETNLRERLDQMSPRTISKYQ